MFPYDEQCDDPVSEYIMCMCVRCCVCVGHTCVSERRVSMWCVHEIGKVTQ
jgi:hypothetical protein